MTTAVRSTARPDPAPVDGLPGRGHLDQVDLFRIATFAAVVGVHTIASGSAGLTVTGNGLLMLAHYTREAFFFLTGFVLSYSLLGRTFRLGRFWRRRLTLIGIPYLTWSVIYVFYGRWRGLQFGVTLAPLWHQLWFETLLGQASYHLYFLLVSIQIYLVFPLLHRARAAITAHPVRALVATAAVSAAVMYLSHGSYPSGQLGELIHRWAYLTVFPYVFWVLGGALAAWRMPLPQTWLWRHRVLILVGSLASFVLALAVYAVAVQRGVLPPDAADALQPVMVLSATGAILVQAVLALAWVVRRRPGSRATRTVMWGSSAAFGVYLLHPIVLDRLLAHGFNGDGQQYLFFPWAAGLPHVVLVQPWAGLVTWVLTLGISSLVVGLVRLTPLSLPLTGRAWQRPRWLPTRAGAAR